LGALFPGGGWITIPPPPGAFSGGGVDHDPAAGWITTRAPLKPGGEFGVLYLARHEAGAFIETFGHETGIRVLDMKELEGRALSRVEAARPLRLVDLRGKGLARLGADAELLTGAYELSQAWALALHNHPAAVDGIAYRARHDPDQFCAAVFERAAPHVTAARLGALTTDALAPLVAHLLDLYDFGLA
jgi:hypothetical protein